MTGLSTLTPTYLFVLVRGEYRRPFTCSLLVWASVRPHSLSGHEADSLTWEVLCNRLCNRPSYSHNNRCNDETFDAVFHTGDYLFICCYWNNIGTVTRKAPTFLWGLLQFDLRLERRTRFELATFCLEGRCSANWATTACWVRFVLKLVTIIQLNRIYLLAVGVGQNKEISCGNNYSDKWKLLCSSQWLIAFFFVELCKFCISGLCLLHVNMS